MAGFPFGVGMAQRRLGRGRSTTTAAELRGIDLAPAPTVTIAAEAPPAPVQGTGQAPAARPTPKRSAARERLQLSLAGALPRTRADLFRACGANPKDGTYRAALKELHDDGLVAEQDGLWTLAGGATTAAPAVPIPAVPNPAAPDCTAPPSRAVEPVDGGVVIRFDRAKVQADDTNGRAA